MGKHIGKQSILFDQPVNILEGASIVGPKEGKGPLRHGFDIILEDVLWCEDTWEKAESKLARESIKLVVKKADKKFNEIDYICGGDLLNQLVATTFAVRDFKIPFFGLYGACSTMGESLQVGSILIDGGYANCVIAEASSHYCGAEKQFRYPLEYGNQRKLYATWTVTGSGAVILTKEGDGPYITKITTGKVVDYGVKDVMNMGGAMAPAAADTLCAHFEDFGTTPEDYDLIITGDLGSVGQELFIELMKNEGYDLKNKAFDCGIEIFDSNTQDTHAGGSGCGCSAVTLTGYLLEKMNAGDYNKLLFMPTGALLSTLSSQQGESIPCIAHAVVIEKRRP